MPRTSNIELGGESMRRKDKLVSDLSILHNVIHRAKVCRLGLVNGEYPYIVPLSFGFDGTHIFFHSAPSGGKVDILRNNNHVCVEFEQDIEIIAHEQPCLWSARFLTVIIHGTAEMLVEQDQKSYGLSQILAHYQPEGAPYAFAGKELESVSVYKITPAEITGKISGIKL